MIRRQHGLILILLLAASTSAQTPLPHRKLEQTRLRVHRFKSSLDSMEMALHTLDDRARALSGDIALFSAKDLLSSGERRQLAALRRRSQGLTAENHRLEQEKHRTRQKFDRALDSLLLGIEQVTDSLARQAPIDRAALHRWQQRTLAYRGLQKTDKQPATTWTALKAAPGDTPRLLRLKGDWLSDREAALRKEAVDVAKRLENLNREARIRSHVADMDRELALFNEDEELFARSTRQTNEMSALDNPDMEYNEIRGNSGSTLLDRPALELTAPVPASPATLKAWIKRLHTYQNRLQIVADSLQQQAARFYTLAQPQKRQR